MNPISQKIDLNLQTEDRLSGLPSELLENIVEELPKSAIYDLALTSKFWRRFIARPIVLASIMNRDDILLSVKQQVTIAARAGQFVQKMQLQLCLRLGETLTTDKLKQLVTQCPNLKIFGLIDLDYQNEPDIDLAPLCQLTHLKRLTLKTNRSFFENFDLEGFNSLEDLDIKGLEDTKLSKMPFSLKNVRVEPIYKYSKLVMGAIYRLPRLVNLPFENLTDDLHKIQSRDLTDLNFSENYEKELVSEFLLKFTNLKSLSYYWPIDLTGFDKLVKLVIPYKKNSEKDFSYLRNLTQLRSLVVGLNQYDKNFDLGNLTLLEDLELRLPQGHPPIFLNPNGLKKLTLDFSKARIDYNSIELKRFTHLTQLDLFSIKPFEWDDAFTNLLSSISISKLFIHKCRFKVAKDSFKILTSITTLWAYTGLAKYPELDVITSLPNLTHLYLKKVYAKGFDKVTNLTRLQQLDVDNEYYISDLGFLDRLPNLVGFGLLLPHIEAMTPALDRVLRPYIPYNKSS